MILSVADSIKIGSSQVDRVYHGENFEFLGYDFSYTRDGSIVNGNGTPPASLAGDTLLTSLIADYATIDAESFSGCTNLTKVILGDGVTNVDINAFDGCGITDLTISPNISSFLNRSFKSNPFTNVTLPPRSYGYGFETGVFENCTNLTSFTLPENSDHLGHEMFQGCTSLTGLTLPFSLKIIGKACFSGCTSLQNFTFPNNNSQNICEIHQSAFKGCTSLTTVDIPGDIDVIESAAFSDCTGITTFNIRKGSPPGGVRLGSSSYPASPANFLPSTLSEIHVPSDAAGWSSTFNGATVIADL